MAIDAKKIYLLNKKGEIQFDEEKHCTLILNVMDCEGTMSAFCVKAGISDGLFYKWLHKYPIFNECYRTGCMISRENWEDEGRMGKGDESFNLELWRTQGAARYGVGKTNRVRIHIDANSTPYEQYKQLINQASMGDFTSSEFKQLIEGINVGIRAYESFELQREVDTMKKDLEKMNQNNANNIIPITKTA